jgi:hypothetical protein
MRVYQYYNALLYHLLQGCVDLSGTHYRIDSDFVSQHFMAGDLTLSRIETKRTSGRPGMIVPDATVRERARPREVVRVS